jgi:phytoene/squalene synthetase
MAAHGLELAELQSGKEPSGLRALLEELSGSAREHLEKLRRAIAGLKPALLPAFAPCGAVEPRLRAVARNSDPLHKVSTISPLRHHWAVRRAGRAGP